MSLDEARAAIDAIDDRIVALLAQRQAQVRAVAAVKTDEQAVRAPERRAALMARLHERANEEGVDPDVVMRTYEAMVDAFIDLELRALRDR